MQAGPRAWINLANGSTLVGMGVAALGGARVARSRDRLFVGTGYRLPLPPAPAFCLGNVIVTRLEGLDPSSALFRHEARHATQFAWGGGGVVGADRRHRLPQRVRAAGRADRRRLHGQAAAAYHAPGPRAIWLAPVSDSGPLAGSAGRCLPWRASA